METNNYETETDTINPIPTAERLSQILHELGSMYPLKFSTKENRRLMATLLYEYFALKNLKVQDLVEFMRSIKKFLGTKSRFTHTVQERQEELLAELLGNFSKFTYQDYLKITQKYTHREETKLTARGMDVNLVNLQMYYDESTARGMTITGMMAMKMKPSTKRAITQAVSGLGELLPFRQDTKYSTKLLKELLVTMEIPHIVKNDRIKVPPLQPTVIEKGDDFEPTKFLEKYYPFSYKIFNKGVPIYTKAPDNADLKNYHLPSFTPTYKHGATDSELMYTIKSLIGFQPEVALRQYAYDIGAKMTDVYNKNWFSNGNIKGQIGRLHSVYQNYLRCRENRVRVGFKLKTHEMLAKMMEAHWPLNKSDVVFDNKPSVIVNRYERNDNNVKLYKSLVSINGKSDAGVVWSPSTNTALVREDTYNYELDIANELYTAFSDTAPEQVLNLYRYMTVCKIKPKEEVYLRATAYDKTRNIHVQDAGANMQAQMLLSQPYGHAPTILDDDTGRTWSMIGLNFFGGNMDKLIKRFQQRPSTIGVYADNFYMIVEFEGRKCFVSCDGVKNESSCTNIDAKAVMYRAIQSYNTPPNEAWYNYGMHFYDQLSCNSIGLIGEQQIAIPWLASGAVGTGYINQVATIDFVETLREVSRGIPKVVFKDGAYHFVDGAETSKRCARFFTIESLVDLSRKFGLNEEVAFDFLGYNAIRLDFVGMMTFG